MSKKLKFFIQSQWEIFRGDWLGKAGVAILACFILMAIFAPLVAPHRPDEMIYSDGRLVRLQPPTWKHLFGTTQMGQDIFSQVIYGSQAAVLVGMLSAFLVSIIGTAVGVVSGYYGGRIDAFLMRFVRPGLRGPLSSFHHPPGGPDRTHLLERGCRDYPSSLENAGPGDPRPRSFPCETGPLWRLPASSGRAISESCFFRSHPTSCR